MVVLVIPAKEQSYSENVYAIRGVFILYEDIICLVTRLWVAASRDYGGTAPFKMKAIWLYAACNSARGQDTCAYPPRFLQLQKYS